MNIPIRAYHSKLLLFGEYTILEGGSAIAFPLASFSGAWNKGVLSSEAKSYLSFLKGINYLDSERIDQFLESGYSFASNIPVGYGLGSSGAVTAAAYDIFKKEETDNIVELLDRLSGMEAYFHGKSSGLDPLCSYMDSCVLQRTSGLQVNDTIGLPSGLFLVDSAQSRSTSTMVSIFKNKILEDGFRKAVFELKQLSEAAIDSLINLDSEALRQQFMLISQLQFEWFSEMLVPSVEALWKAGLESGEYYLKLSGAGGGGFYLGLGHLESKESVIQIS